MIDFALKIFNTEVTNLTLEILENTDAKTQIFILIRHNVHTWKGHIWRYFHKWIMDEKILYTKTIHYFWTDMAYISIITQYYKHNNKN